MMRRWLSSIVLFVLAVVLLAAGARGLGLIAPGILLLGAIAVSPRAFPRGLTDAQARKRSARDGKPIVYWRPGCPFCLRLRASLGRRANRLHWVDIWDDPAGAATVRAVAGGNETVPTVVAGERSWVNPAPAEVRDLVRAPGR
jgi:mycoredoxin